MTCFCNSSTWLVFRREICPIFSCDYNVVNRVQLSWQTLLMRNSGSFFKASVNTNNFIKAACSHLNFPEHEIKSWNALEQIHWVSNFNVFMLWVIKNKQNCYSTRERMSKNPSFIACYFNCCWPIADCGFFFCVRFNQRTSSFRCL